LIREANNKIYLEKLQKDLEVASEKKEQLSSELV